MLTQYYFMFHFLSDIIKGWKLRSPANTNKRCSLELEDSEVN
jgi:hypothetical protein